MSQISKSKISKLSLAAAVIVISAAGVATSASAAQFHVPRTGSPVFVGRGSTVMLNPQPLPPRVWLQSSSSRFNSVMLNPQPLPPRMFVRTSVSRFDSVMLNPQPLPPRYFTRFR